MKKLKSIRRCAWASLILVFLLAACVQPNHSSGIRPLSSPGILPEEPVLRIENGMHTATITSVSTDRDNRFVLTTSLDTTARLWDAASGRLLNIFRVPSGYGLVGPLKCGAISPDGNTIAVGGWTGPVPGKKHVYIFDRKTGEIVHRLPGLPAVILHLEFSPSGRYLAATTGRGGGLYVWEAENGKRIFQDTGYQEETHGLDFDRHGRLVTASFDGFVRLYDDSFHLITMRGIAGGREPSSAAFSPDGTLVAVGFNDSTKINILSGTDLSYLYTPDTGDIGKGSLAAVTWAKKNKLLFAGGKRNKNNRWQLLQWPGYGKKSCKKIQLAITDSLGVLCEGKRNQVFFAADDPAVGSFKVSGKTGWFNRSPIADFSGKPDGLRISATGATIQLELSGKVRRVISFTLSEKGAVVQQGNVTSDRSVKPRTRSEQTLLTHWQHQNYRHYAVPLFNNKPIILEKFESSWSADIRSGSQGFVLGTDRFIRAYDSQGILRWKKPVQTAWAVNISGNGNTLVAALRDGTVRWYDWDNGRELLALYMQNSGKEWVVWTPAGFFDHSPGAEQIIGFQVNKGWNQLPDFISVGQMYNALYRPDIFVSDFLGNDQQYQQTTRQIDINRVVQNGLPPKVKIDLPAGKTNQKSITAKITVASGKGGIGKVVYRVNGITRLEDKESKKYQGKNKIILSKELPLEPGKNTIKVTAYNKTNEIESRPAVTTVYRKTTVGQRSRKPDLYILAIGINKYRDHALELKYPVQDAKSFVEILHKSSSKLFNTITTEYLLDNEVTEKELGTVFRKLKATIQPDDVFVLYMAGHGLAVNGNYYFIPWDLVYKNEQSVVRKGVSREVLQRFLAMIPANKAVILLDTCNAGAFAGVVRRGLGQKTAVSKLIRATGRATIVASTDTQAAYEGYQGHGVFTWSLIEALKGKADKKGNRDGIISVNELAEFVMEEVPKITLKKWKYEQFPLQDLTGRSFPLGMVK